ncbi:MAG: methyltransferase domain-containing protein [Fibrobacteria bacterium]|nr:methyltransferase domain-containing protein [Fibrobacteria bacterium]
MKASSYAALRDFIYATAGIQLGESKQALVLARVGQRLRALGLDDPDAYIREVLQHQDQEEIVHLLDAISTNFTSFFREEAHFHRLTGILRDWKSQGQKKFRIWCAAASTGEEPYTLSMVCQEALGDFSDLKILCTDISTRVLETGRRGVYHLSKMDPVPPQSLQRWFGPPDEESFVSAKPALRGPLSFARLNLAEVPYPMKGPFDVVFCRNVMIYFDVAGRTRFVTEAARLLRPGGFLFVGHAESVAGIAPGFRAVAPSVYQRVVHG